MFIAFSARGGRAILALAISAGDPVLFVLLGGAWCLRLGRDLQACSPALHRCSGPKIRHHSMPGCSNRQGHRPACWCRFAPGLLSPMTGKLAIFVF